MENKSYARTHARTRSKYSHSGTLLPTGAVMLWRTSARAVDTGRKKKGRGFGMMKRWARRDAIGALSTCSSARFQAPTLGVIHTPMGQRRIYLRARQCSHLPLRTRGGVGSGYHTAHIISPRGLVSPSTPGADGVPVPPHLSAQRSSDTQAPMLYIRAQRDIPRPDRAHSTSAPLGAHAQRLRAAPMSAHTARI
ncbi:hypothetical protein C8F04DRAFT_1274018 [Mycena alexandri]|uniref:Uncharacterized protein n=1 Tax=Mycena alexandri TaxID=1745969 RepID=A0AAD6S7G1_9AGAR|nr:hypothetical protein C8F04DRAFT_1274018 [Mycena alexandri]